MTQEICKARCSSEGYTYAGLENAYTCYVSGVLSFRSVFLPVFSDYVVLCWMLGTVWKLSQHLCASI